MVAVHSFIHSAFPSLLAFCPVTVITEDGKVTYRRRDSGRFFMKNEVRLTNQHVVPFNPYLLLRFNCHLNVVIINSVRAVKYILCLSPFPQFLSTIDACPSSDPMHRPAQHQRQGGAVLWF